MLLPFDFRFWYKAITRLGQKYQRYKRVSKVFPPKLTNKLLHINLFTCTNKSLFLHPTKVILVNLN